MTRAYEVLFYNGWQDVPAYYLVSSVEGRSPKEALRKNFGGVIESVREQFDLTSDIDDGYILESLFVLRNNGLVAAAKTIGRG